MLGDIAVVALFILIGGCFNAAEISMISLRESQVRHLAATAGSRGQRLERLVSNPNRFLAAVQIGVTVATMLSSAFGAATVSGRVAQWLRGLGVGDASEAVGLIGTTLVISFFSLVLGELTPKRIGMQRREAIALFAAGPLSVLARLFRPVVWLLGRSTDMMVRLLGGDPDATGEEITAEELQSLVVAHESLSNVERRMIADVFEAEDTHVRQVMVPRREVVFLSAALTVSRGARLAVEHLHSRFPVIGRDADEVVGVVHIRDLLLPNPALGRSATIGDLATPVTVVPGTKGVLDALHEMRTDGQHLAIVVDEYGGTDGIVTLEDLVEEIVGEMVPERSVGTPPRAGEVDGLTNLDDFAEATGLALPPGPYSTVAGFLMARLGRLPQLGDAIEVDGRSLGVVALDGRRVSRIAVSVIVPAAPAGPDQGAVEGDRADRSATGSAGPGSTGAGPGPAASTPESPTGSAPAPGPGPGPGGSTPIPGSPATPSAGPDRQADPAPIGAVSRSGSSRATIGG